jgi:hypothetical protein
VVFRRSLLLNNSNDSERLSIELPVKFYTQVYQRLDGSLSCFSYVLNVVKATSIFEKVKTAYMDFIDSKYDGLGAVKRHFLILLA